MDEVTAIAHRAFLDCDFAIINPLQVEQSEWGAMNNLPIVPKGLEAHQKMLPHLAVLRGMSFEDKCALLARTEAHQHAETVPLVSALLASTATPECMAAHLARQMVRKTPFGASFLLRYYDPVVFRHLLWIFNARQLASLLGCVDAWYYPSPDMAHWYMQRVPHYSVEMKSALDSAQWGSLHRIGLINTVVKEAKREALLPVVDAVAFARIDRYLRMAIEDVGFTEASDQRLYALQALRFGSEWLHGQDAIQKIARSKAEGISYTGLCMEEG